MPIEDTHLKPSPGTPKFRVNIVKQPLSIFNNESRLAEITRRHVAKTHHDKETVVVSSILNGYQQTVHLRQ